MRRTRRTRMEFDSTHAPPRPLFLQPLEERLAELGDLGLDHRAAIGIAAADAREVFLVLGLGDVERGGRRDLGHDRVAPELARLEARDDLARGLLLLRRVAEDRGA